MKVLVTGANGQLGTELMRRPRPAGLVLSARDRAALDVTDPAAVAAALADTDAALVINAAAYTAVDRAEDQPDAAFAVNRDAPAHLAAAAAARGAAVIHVSTDYVFDGTKGAPYTEDDPVAPLGVYGASKEAGERAVRERLDRHLILRTAWVYAAHGANFVRTMLRLAGERPHLRVVADQRGAPTAAADLADGILALAARIAVGADGPWGTYHCTCAGETSWHGLAEAVFTDLERRTGTRPTCAAITTAAYPTKARRPADSRLACDRLAADWGVRLRPWQAALADVLAELHGPAPAATERAS